MIDTTQFTDKASKNPAELKLYEDNDYITAYGLHTDLRIERDGFQAAIGSNDKAGQGWDEHGQTQLNFLISQGLQPQHNFLDFGCGTGRLACKAIPYLEARNYTGVDISTSAIEQCKSNHWGDKKPVFIHGEGGFLPVKDQQFHLIWSHSVLTHTPREIAEEMFKDVSEMAFGVWLFTYKHADEYRRSGLKQFQYSPYEFSGMAGAVGLKAEPIDLRWPAGQRTMKVWREI